METTDKYVRHAWCLPLFEQCALPLRRLIDTPLFSSIFTVMPPQKRYLVHCFTVESTTFSLFGGMFL